ncbi:hypothetical protein EYC84_004940 [Monilinia fructicola]|uniref:Uncharacterized protein n=1 Tax=Monilinia fructicola TaxID=38448 RepID=A0A5M9K718_MONFR|nr:hypothetical protein EYC84_004940 [Monilinia fructicola]
MAHLKWEEQKVMEFGMLPANVGKAEVEEAFPVDVEAPVITEIDPVDVVPVDVVELDAVVFVDAAAAEDSEAATLERFGRSEVAVVSAVVGVVAAIIGMANNEIAKAAEAADFWNRMMCMYNIIRIRV